MAYQTHIIAISVVNVAAARRHHHQCIKIIWREPVAIVDDDGNRGVDRERNSPLSRIGRQWYYYGVL